AHAGHGHDGVQHAGPLHHGAAGGAHHADHAGAGTGHHDPGASHPATAGHAHGHPISKLTGRDALWALASPRVWFSFLVGAGSTGLIARIWLIEPLVAVCAVTGGVIFERYVVSPIWRLLLRFESRPAATLESTIFEEARAETDFDAEGRGLISMELDGQIVQLLGRLKPEDRKAGV